MRLAKMWLMVIAYTSIHLHTCFIMEVVYKCINIVDVVCLRKRCEATCTQVLLFATFYIISHDKLGIRQMNAQHLILHVCKHSLTIPE